MQITVNTQIQRKTGFKTIIGVGNTIISLKGLEIEINSLAQSYFHFSSNSYTTGLSLVEVYDYPKILVILEEHP